MRHVIERCSSNQPEEAGTVSTPDEELEAQRGEVT